MEKVTDINQYKGFHQGAVSRIKDKQKLLNKSMMDMVDSMCIDPVKFSVAPDPLEIGDIIILDVGVFTKWNRFLYWLIKRPIPTRKQKFTVIESYSDAAKIIKPLVLDE